MKVRIMPVLALVMVMFLSFGAAAKKSSYYQVTIYHFKNGDQEKLIDSYLQNALLPTLHRNGINNVGVFKPITNDTASNKLIYVLQSFKDLKQLTNTPDKLMSDAAYTSAGESYLASGAKTPPYTRMENIIIRSFELAPELTLPKLTSPKEDHIYELRSYEGPTERFYKSKVKMFNQGGEISLFARLNFNAVFYGEVLAGSKMPNLMYMTSFENRAARDEHWKTFSADPEWKKLSALPEYQNTVSHADIILMKAAPYSDY